MMQMGLMGRMGQIDHTQTCTQGGRCRIDEFFLRTRRLAPLGFGGHRLAPGPFKLVSH